MPSKTTINHVDRSNSWYPRVGNSNEWHTPLWKPDTQTLQRRGHPSAAVKTSAEWRSSERNAYHLTFGFWDMISLSRASTRSLSYPVPSNFLTSFSWTSLFWKADTKLYSSSLFPGRITCGLVSPRDKTGATSSVGQQVNKQRVYSTRQIVEREHMLCSSPCHPLLCRRPPSPLSTPSFLWPWRVCFCPRWAHEASASAEPSQPRSGGCWGVCCLYRG